MSDDVVTILMRQLEALNGKLDEVKTEVSDIKAKFAALEVRTSVMSPCPSPGKCGDLEDSFGKSIEALRKDVDEHKILVAEMRGGWKALVVVCAICSTLGGVVGWGVSVFLGK